MVTKEIKFSRGVPPTESFPIDRLVECSRAALEKYGNDILQYGASRGFAPLCHLLAEKAGVADNRVVIGQGSLSLQDYLARNILGSGTLAYVEKPSYDRTVNIFKKAKADVVGIPLQDDGMDVDFLEHRLKAGERPVILYIIPDFQNPSGVVLSEEKRRRVAALADLYGFWVMEDVPYRVLRYAGEDVPSMFDIAPHRTIQMSSYSKQIAPGLRVGYAILPDDLAAPMAKTLEDAYISPTFLAQAAVFDFIQRGWLAENLASLRKLYKPRKDALLAALDQHFGDMATWFRPDGGFFVGMNVNGKLSQTELLKRCKENGLIMTDGRAFFTDDSGENFIRLPFCALTEDELREGTERLAGIVRELVH